MSKSPVQGSAGQAEHADPAEKSDEKKKVLQAPGQILHHIARMRCVHDGFASTTDEHIRLKPRRG